MTSNPSGALKKTFSSAFSLFLSERKEKKIELGKKKQMEEKSQRKKYLGKIVRGA